MKKTKLAFLNLMVATFICGPCLVEAQYNPALLPDVTYTTPLWPNSGTHPNNASADYALQPVASWGGPYIVKACAADYSATNASGMVYIDDNQGGGWYGFYIEPTSGLTLHPDVVICDNLNFYTYLYTNSFLIPCVYIKSGTIYLQIELFYNAGDPVSMGGSGVITPWTSPIQVSNTGVATGAPHIDVESKYSTLTTWGSPTSDNVTITWTESSGAIKSWSGSINAITALWPSLPANLFGMGMYQTIYNTNNPTDPDVAMVERNTVSGMHDIAIFTFLENTTPVTLKYAEWDITTNTVTTSNLDQGSFAPPRIDAIDNYTYNTPYGHTAYYTVVTTGSNTTYPVYTVLEYNNLTPPGGVDVLHAVGLLGKEKPYNATIACGPTACGGNITTGDYGFTIQYYATGLYTTYLAEQIDWNTGAVLGTNYYEVPMNPVTGNTNAISSSNNEDGSVFNPQHVFSAWDDGTTNLWSKLNRMCPAFGFKQDKKQQATTIEVKKVVDGLYSFRPSIAKDNPETWNVSPNPATDNITLTTSQDISNQEQAQYSLTDITGREYVRSNITQQIENIDLSRYVPGIYLLHIYQPGKEEKTIKVVKQ